MVYIGCHGTSGNHLKSSDGKRVKLRELQKLVSNDSLPQFSGAPKILIINSCRGEARIDWHKDAGKAKYIYI